MEPPKANSYRWLSSGSIAFPAMLAAIDGARASVRLETYALVNDGVGGRFREALVKASQRGVRVRVILDSFGSMLLPSGFWRTLEAAGGEVRWFNPTYSRRFGFRDHRKILVCDDAIAFVGGFNVSDHYDGDGVTAGWSDIGMQITGSLAPLLARAFDVMLERSQKPHQAFARLRPTTAKQHWAAEDGDLLLTGPGRGRNPFKRRLLKDLRRARNVRILAAYFLPTWSIHRALVRVLKRGGRVQLILPGKSDVYLSQLACRSLYRRLLRAGVEIYEYQPQILHAKLILIDEVVYAGSSNLDPRSLGINYEVMLRFSRHEIAAGARKVFQDKLAHSKRIELEFWRRTRTWFQRLQQRWAHFILARVDPIVARWHYK
jgi:cardiolipin synthase